jgi:hypothetical protein
MGRSMLRPYKKGPARQFRGFGEIQGQGFERLWNYRHN